MTQHKDLTGADLHEPKGAATAPANTVYFSNGSGSGTWRKVTGDDIDSGNIPALNSFTQAIYVNNINTSKTNYYTVGLNGNLRNIRGIIDNTVTTNTNVQFLKNGITVLGTATITAGSPAGGSISFDVLPTVPFVPGDVITVVTNGTGTAICSLNVVLTFNY